MSTKWRSESSTRRAFQTIDSRDEYTDFVRLYKWHPDDQTRVMDLMLEFAAFAGLGIFGGALTTVAAMGGGIAMVALLSLLVGPHSALATTAPALLVGNVHRAYVYRRELDRKTCAAFALGALPGSALGALYVGALAPAWLNAALIVVTLFALARSRGLVTVEPPTWAWTPFAFAAGLIAAGSGAGVLVAPALVAGGLTEGALLATSSVIAVTMHLGRITGYGLSGLYQSAELLHSLALALGIVTGNAVGSKLRTWLGREGTDRATQATLWTSLGLTSWALLAR
jgi:uncharacterized protein